MLCPIKTVVTEALFNCAFKNFMSKSSSTVLIGDNIYARFDIKRVTVQTEPANTSSKKVKVLLKNGQAVEVPVDEDFDMKFLNAQLNSASVTTVLIGHNIYQKFEVSQVSLIKEEPKEPEQPTDPIEPPVTEPPTTEEPPEGTGEGGTTVSQTKPKEQQ